MSITLAEGVIVRVINTILGSAYIAAILAALIVGPLILLHGYRQWWLVIVYAVVACAVIGGLISHHRIAGRNGKS
jgi:H+/gluconate symporter-like permease